LVSSTLACALGVGDDVADGEPGGAPHPTTNPIAITRIAVELPIGLVEHITSIMRRFRFL